MMNSSDVDHLLWFDMETTGENPREDDVIEVGCVITTVDLVEICSYTTVLKPSESALARLMALEPVRVMHEANGLLVDAVNTSSERTIDDVTEDLFALMDEHGVVAGRVVLAGSGIARFDIPFIAEQMPLLNSILPYWCLDIGSIRRAHEMWVGTEVTTVNDDKTHRALDDVYCHIEEARAYAALWNSTDSAPAVVSAP